eukprot:653609-Pelagomonas_calceolata.AAC.7
MSFSWGLLCRMQVCVCLALFVPCTTGFGSGQGLPEEHVGAEEAAPEGGFGERLIGKAKGALRCVAGSQE